VILVYDLDRLVHPRKLDVHGIAGRGQAPAVAAVSCRGRSRSLETQPADVGLGLGDGEATAASAAGVLGAVTKDVLDEHLLYRRLPDEILPEAADSRDSVTARTRNAEKAWIVDAIANFNI
jgi:hypothetical protein